MYITQRFVNTEIQGRGPRFCISKKLPGNADVAGLWTTI